MYAYSLFFIMLIYGLFSVVILINVIGSVGKTLCLMLERMHFRNAYGLSVQRMLAESPIDRTEVRRLAAPRDRRAQVKAAMAGIKQNGILGWLLRGSWLTSSEYLV